MIFKLLIDCVIALIFAPLDLAWAIAKILKEKKLTSNKNHDTNI